MMLYDNLLLVHPKITDPNKHSDSPGYWLTCVAMPISGPNARVLSPAAVTVDGSGHSSPWPWAVLISPTSLFCGPDIDHCATTDTCAFQNDQSFLGKIPYQIDFFFHIEPDQTPWIAMVQEDGFTVVHSHPNFMNGAKFFQWGWNDPTAFTTKIFYLAQIRTAQTNKTARNNSPTIPTAWRLILACTWNCRSDPHVYKCTLLTYPCSLLWSGSRLFWGDTKKLQSLDCDVAVKEGNNWIDGPDDLSDEVLAELDVLMKSMADMEPTQNQIVFEGIGIGPEGVIVIGFMGCTCT